MSVKYMTTKEIIIDNRVREEYQQSREIIKNPSEYLSKSSDSSKPDVVENLYHQVVRQLSDGMSNSPAQVEYLNTLATALTVFKVAAQESYKNMDIVTLENQHIAQEVSLQSRIKNSIEKIKTTLYDSLPTTKNTSGTDFNPFAPANSQSSNQPSLEVLAEKIVKDSYVKKATQTLVKSNKKITDAINTSNSQALAFAGNVGLELLGVDPVDIRSRAYLGDLAVDRDVDKLVAHLSSVIQNDLTKTTKNMSAKLAQAQNLADKKNITAYQAQQEIKDDYLKETLALVFTAWTKQYVPESHKSVLKERKVDDITTRYGTFSMKNGLFVRKNDLVIRDDRIMNVRKSDIIGNAEFVNVLWNNGMALLGYNQKEKDNKFKPASTIFTYGDPGCGKTYTAHGVLQSLADVAQRVGLPLKIMSLNVSDFASTYQNATALRLEELAEEINRFNGPVIMYVGDADTIFQSRNAGNITQEQNQTTGVFLKMFDGQLIEKNGKFTTIMDANFIDGIDPATRSRLFDEIQELKRFDQPSHYVEYIKRKLVGLDNFWVKDKDLMPLGKYILDNNVFSNRTIDHVLKGMQRGFVVTEDMLLLSQKEKSALTKKHMRSTITATTLRDSFENYAHTLKNIEKASYKARQGIDDVDVSDKAFMKDILDSNDPTILGFLEELNREKTTKARAKKANTDLKKDKSKDSINQ